MKKFRWTSTGLLGACIGIICGIGLSLIVPVFVTTNVQAVECPSYKQFYDATCPFCRIVAKIDPAVVLYEDDLVMAFEKKPIRNPVNCLIIPKKHVVNFKALNTNDPCDAQIVARMVQVAQQLSKKLDGNGDFKIHVNNGVEADQTVPHLHMHFVSKQQWK